MSLIKHIECNRLTDYVMFLKETLAISCFWLAVSELPRLRAPTAEQCKWTAEFYCPEIVPTSFPAKPARCILAIRINCHIFPQALENRNELKQLEAYRTCCAPLVWVHYCPRFLWYIIYSCSNAFLERKRRKTFWKQGVIGWGMGENICLTV